MVFGPPLERGMMWSKVASSGVTGAPLLAALLKSGILIGPSQ